MGPDGLQYNCHDLRKEKEIYSKRMQGWRFVTVWRVIFWKGLVRLVRTEKNMDSQNYCSVLEGCLLNFSDASFANNWILQQDNASVHKSDYTAEWLNAADVDVLDWPAKSPDSNLIENI